MLPLVALDCACFCFFLIQFLYLTIKGEAGENARTDHQQTNSDKNGIELTKGHACEHDVKLIECRRSKCRGNQRSYHRCSHNHGRLKGHNPSHEMTWCYARCEWACRHKNGGAEEAGQ